MFPLWYIIPQIFTGGWAFYKSFVTTALEKAVAIIIFYSHVSYFSTSPPQYQCWKTASEVDQNLYRARGGKKNLLSVYGSYGMFEEIDTII